MRQAHDKVNIQTGDRHDTILRRLLGGANWQEVNPITCRRDWHTGPQLQTLTHSLALSTDISTCRVHLERRWPAFTIINHQTLKGRVRQTQYKIMSLSEASEFERDKQARRIGQRGAASVQGGGQGVMASSASQTYNQTPSAVDPALRFRHGILRQGNLFWTGERIR